jgi:hypothetical protein
VSFSFNGTGIYLYGANRPKYVRAPLLFADQEMPS